MAQFYGTVQGQRGTASRLGHKSSGLQVVAASWAGAVRVALSHDARTGLDMARVTLGEWRGQGPSPAIVLFDGPVSGAPAAAIAAE